MKQQHGYKSYLSGRYEEALADYRAAQAEEPDWFEPFWHAGACCHQLRRYADAFGYYQRALALCPGHARILYHYAKCLKDDGQLDAALLVYEQALTFDPGNAEILYSFGLLHLLRGDWIAGWAGFARRFEGSDRAAVEHRPVTSLPAWRGSNVPSGSGIVVYSEQGMGDTLQCFRYASLLRQHFAKVKFSVQFPLVSLLRANAGEGIEVVARVASPIDEKGYTHFVDMMSLPELFRTTPETVPPAPYLAASHEGLIAWRKKLGQDPRPKVGVAWQGGKLTCAPARDMDFECLQPLLSRDDIVWISLQKDVPISAETGLIDWREEMHDFAATAGLIGNLDLVITVDTAVAHLAGAMGRPVWLLNRYESEWRWMRGMETSPWYPSMRIFSQEIPGEWNGVMRKVSAVLEHHFLSMREQPMDQQKKFLHIGCGSNHKDKTTPGFNTPEWRELRLDINPNVKPDIVASMLEMGEVPDASVDAIFSSHNIEHLYPHEVPRAIKEFVRVLKSDGFLVLACPDLQSVCALIAEDKLLDPVYMSPAGPITPLDILYGYRSSMERGNLYMAHRCGFTRKELHSMLQQSGFAVVATTARGKAPFFDLWALASKSARSEEEIRALIDAHFPR
ncbi:MAG: tetratricopeptide repeat protein [Thermodesulfobacteriota bacterium]